jgi:voltage-gated potassium channel
MDFTDNKIKSKENISHPFRVKLHEIIFEADTFGGKLFDVALLWAIIISVLAVILETVEVIEIRFGEILRIIEWFFTILFTLEYFARIAVVGKPIRYIFSFLGIIDMLAVIPTYLSIFFVGTQYLLVIRSIRLLRVFRIFKLAHFIGEAHILAQALKASARKIVIFLGVVTSLVIIAGTMMYVVEGRENDFTSIPRSIYWAIVTLTTVGYGDIAPKTVVGQILASIIMVMGYAIIAVPTGIVTVELASISKKKINTQVCPQCSSGDHDNDAVYCKYCGARM